MWNYLKYILLPVFFVSFHWIAVRFYILNCAQDGFSGYLSSYFTIASPACVYALTLMEKTSSLFLTGWICFTMGSVGMLKMGFNYLTDSPGIKKRLK